MALALVAFLPQDAGPVEGYGPVERELAIRAWAIDPAAARDGLAAALASERWVRRAAALEALRRALVAGTHGDQAAWVAPLATRVAELATDPEAPDRARALAAVAVWPAALELTPAAFATSPSASPAVVLATARALQGAPASTAIPTLARLAGHADARVRAAARESLAAREDGAGVLAELVAPPGPLDGPDADLRWEAFLDDLERLERCRAEDRTLEDLAARVEDPSARAAVAALRSVVHGSGGIEPLVAGWSRSGAADARRDALQRRAARAARVRGTDLGAALLDAVPSAGGEAWLEGAVEAGEAVDLLARAARPGALSPAQEVELWTLLAGRTAGVPPEAIEPWLGPRAGVDPRLRRAVVGAVAASFREGGDAPSGKLLERVLSDADGSLAILAFRVLAAAESPEPWLASLAAAWNRLGDEERRAHLRWLPRGRDLAPFRAGLAVLGEGDRSARVECAELLAGRGGDAATGERIARWLLDEVAILEAAAGEELASEQRAVGLVGALRDLARAADDAVLAEVAARTEATSEAVAKNALAALAAGGRGTRVLEGWLASEHPSRLRVEAGIALAPRGHERARAVLESAYAGCDVVLRARVLRALAPREEPHEAASPFLVGVAGDPRAVGSLRRLAVEGLARGRDAAPLFDLLAVERDPEVREALFSGLARRPEPACGAALRARFLELDRGPLEGLPEELRLAEREVLLSALASGPASAWSDELAGPWLSRAFLAADEDLLARFYGERLPRPDFRFSGEVAVAGALARRGELSATLERAGAWWGLDGRLLARLAAEARDHEPATAAALLRAARVALEGEEDGEDGPRERLALRVEALALAEARRDWPRFAALAEGLLTDWRALRLSERAFAEAFGEFDPVAGVDPGARLASAARQARAWSALDAGDLDAARAHAAAARASLGASADAARAQANLERELARR